MRLSVLKVFLFVMLQAKGLSSFIPSKLLIIFAFAVQSDFQ